MQSFKLAFCRVYSQDGRIGGFTRNIAAPWMVGELSRLDCERLMLKNGKEKDFVVRSSPHLVRTITYLC